MDIHIGIFIILFLVLLNGFFSASEISIVSVGKARIKTLMELGNTRARLIYEFQSDPDRLFATIQIGSILSTIIAGVIAGVKLSAFLAGHIEPIPFVGAIALEISIFLIVLSITYLSIVIGELIPKSLAYSHAEKVAFFLVRPLRCFSALFSILTTVMTASSNVVLKLFKDRTSFSETRLLAEEIQHLLEEGVRFGSIESTEHEIIANVLDMNDTVAREVMIPRVDIRALPMDSDLEELRKTMDHLYSRLPVFSENLDNIAGILHSKDLMRVIARDEQPELHLLLRPAYFVPETMKIGLILQEMQKRKTHMAIVVDEYGGTAGLLTMEDILEEIVGDIQDVTESPEEEEILEMPDGSFMVTGSCPISEFNEFFSVELSESETYTSVAGFVMEKAGRFPEVGERIEAEGYVFELVKRVRQKMVEFRVRKSSTSDEISVEEGQSSL